MNIYDFLLMFGAEEDRIVNEIFKDGDVKYKKVPKNVARQAWNRGEPVVLCPCKLYPFGGFRPSVIVSKKEWAYAFDDVVKDFQWYNCTLNETGYYASYYVKV